MDNDSLMTKMHSLMSEITTRMSEMQSLMDEMMGGEKESSDHEEMERGSSSEKGVGYKVVR